jgi:hypothetical protein
MQMKNGTQKQRESFSRGFDTGNYGNAYESQCWHTWEAKRQIAARTPEYRAGALLGFFSSYEIDEIDEDIRDEVATLRAEHGEE